MTPFDRMLDSIEWTPIKTTHVPRNDVLYATHSGLLTIGGKTLKVYQLDDGNRVIDVEDMAAFFGFESAEEFQKQTREILDLLSES